MPLTLNDLRQQAVSASLFEPASLRQAIGRFGFVQADPIRAPARAQDLILRHRVHDYSADDLERDYPRLDLEEDFLYAYGFMPLSTWQLLHPRSNRALSPDEQRVLDVVASHRRIHPRELDGYLGIQRARNGWGGYSKATTLILQSLHYQGLVRVAERQNGVRLYELTDRSIEPMDPDERLRQLVLLIAAILGPLSEQSLRAVLHHLAYAAPSLEGRRSVISRLIEADELVQAVVDRVRYVWPARLPVDDRPNETVRFLSPFDPLVWDRRRFAHFWQWTYRFEAYTPASKRQLGYYAMPMLWREDIIGWVNVSTPNGQLLVEPGFKKDPSADLVFDREFDAEVERLRRFLKRRLATT
ncbi:DNA glycosylase AlkZ-like family protein [Spirosoma koreense]